MNETRSSRGPARLLSFATCLLALCSVPLAHAYTNPVITNTRDIDCTRFDGEFHLIEPAGGDVNGGYYKYRTSKDLVNWSTVTQILQRPPGNEVWQGYLYKHTANSTYYLYYTNLNSATGKTIRVASAPAPTGPWTDQGQLITSMGGIDPYLFKDSDATLWLYYKNDADGEKNIWVQKLSNPTTKTSGYNAKKLIQPQPGTWEDNGYVSAEGPCMRKYAGKYFLLYTGGPYGQFDYAIGYAYSTTPDGTFTKYSGNPIMSNVESPNVYSPGVPTVVQDGSAQDWVVYRQRETAVRQSPRQVTIDKLNVSSAGSNVINGVATSGTSLTSPVPLP
ncbi:MAG: family 43 glycosylhydrolase [Verrucomicrobiota bacterium]